MDAISRKEFIQACTALGLGATFAEEALAAPSSRRRGKVIIVGAGAAGLTAAYMLKRQKVKVRILEASNTIGGRLRKLEGFADFPIDLGGEWIHVHPRILKRIVDNNRVKINSPTVKYEIGSYFEWDGQAMQEYPAAPFFPTDYKFVRSTWIDFLNTYITPRVRRDIRLNRPVRSIRYSDDSVRVTTKDGKVETADKIIVTASLAMLQSRTIKFSPALPPDKKRALRSSFMPGGMKVFFKFTERFFPLGFGFASDNNVRYGERYFYDPGFGQNSNDIILGVFMYGQPADRFLEMDSETIKNTMLAELDQAFAGRASQTYVSHVVQNWSKEPYVRGAYAEFISRSSIRNLATPIMNTVYFAGEAIPKDLANYGFAHGAALSGAAAANRLAKTLPRRGEG